MLIEPIQSGTDPRADVVNSLNAVELSPAHIQAALEVLAMLPLHAQYDPRAQAMVLEAYVHDAALPSDAIVSAALHARVSALAKWTATHDPDRQSNGEAVIEATARFSLSELADGIGFDPAGFQEMILFIEELPW